MSAMPLGGIVSSVAGAPLSQTHGSAAERARQDATSVERSADADRRAEGAAGIGRTEGDQQASDRDADGRRAWEFPDERSSEQEAAEQKAAELRAAELNRPRPPSLDGSGGALDLTG
ncbi:MAG: hypothetical protein ACRCT8_08355 [Lacipirellulaceae bacterium]